MRKNNGCCDIITRYAISTIIYPQLFPITRKLSAKYWHGATVGKCRVATIGRIYFTNRSRNECVARW